MRRVMDCGTRLQRSDNRTKGLALEGARAAAFGKDQDFATGNAVMRSLAAA